MKTPILALAISLIVPIAASAAPVKDLDYIAPMNFGLHTLSVRVLGDQVRLIVGPGLLSYGEGDDMSEVQTRYEKLSRLFGLERLNALVIDVPAAHCQAHETDAAIVSCVSHWNQASVTVRGANIGWLGEIEELSANSVAPAYGAEIEVQKVTRVTATSERTTLDARVALAITLGENDRVEMNLAKPQVKAREPKDQ